MALTQFIHDQDSCSAGRIGRMGMEVDDQGRGWLWARARENTTVDYAHIIGMGSLGWGAAAVATVSGGYAFIGFAEGTSSTAEWGRHLVMGYNPSCVCHLGASVAWTGGYMATWIGTASGGIGQAAIATGSSHFGSENCAFAVAPDTVVATSSGIGLILFGQMARCSLG